ncbi:hypothetical protein ACJX0J_031050, partial [Zea mays]
MKGHEGYVSQGVVIIFLKNKVLLEQLASTKYLYLDIVNLYTRPSLSTLIGKIPKLALIIKYIWTRYIIIFKHKISRAGKNILGLGEVKKNMSHKKVTAVAENHVTLLALYIENYCLLPC